MRDIVGQVVDNYKVLDVVGRGGMGIVYKAMDVTLDKVVCLKMIDPHLIEDKVFLRRFMDEPKLQAKLHNPNIVQVFAFRQTPQGLFIVMEFVDGYTLSDFVKRNGALPWQNALPIFNRILDAIEAAHSVGIIHRDIKPKNVLMTEGGDVKVTDFGLAKLQSSAGHTMTNTVAGTLNYMSPEQVQGLGKVDQRGDIYSMGMTLYEMLAGRVPFESGATEYSILKNIVEEPLPPPTHFNPAIPAELSMLVMKSLEKNPDHRYQSAREMMMVLEEFTRQNAGATDGHTRGDVTQVRSAGSTATGTRAPAPTAGSVGGFEKPPAASRSGWIVATVAIIMLAAGIFAWQGGYLPIDEETPAGHQVAIFSDPPGASIYVNDQLLGKTPFEDAAYQGEIANIRMELAGYETYENDTLSLQAGIPFTFSQQLKALERAVSTELAVRSSERGARVWINGREMGTVPYRNYDLQPGRYTVEVRKAGFSAWKKQVQLRENDPVSLTATLTATPAEVPDEIREGTLSLVVLPGGELRVDGNKVGNNAARLSLPAGSHRVQFVHSVLGEHSVSVNITADKTRSITCYLQGMLHVNFVGESNWGKVDITGGGINLTEDVPLADFALPPGEYQINAHRSGYRPSGAQIITVKPVTDEARRHHRLVFDMEVNN